MEYKSCNLDSKLVIDENLTDEVHGYNLLLYKEICMGLLNMIFDMDKGDFIMKTSRNTGLDSRGRLIMRLSDHTVMDEDGDIHIVSSWPKDDDNNDSFGL